MVVVDLSVVVVGVVLVHVLIVVVSITSNATATLCGGISGQGPM